MRYLYMAFLALLLLCVTADSQWGIDQQLPAWGQGRWGIEEEAAAASPEDIAGLKIWLEADYGITKNGGALVSAWVDYQNYVTLAQATSTKQPLWVASVASANGQPGVQFDGTSDQIEGDIADIIQPFTIILLANEPTSLGTYRMLFSDAFATSKNYLTYIVSSSMYITKFGTVDKACGTLTPYALGRWRLQYDGAGSAYFFNGVLRSTGTSGTNALVSIALGANYDATAYFGNPTIFCFLVYDHILTAGELVILNSYLTSKFGAGV